MNIRFSQEMLTILGYARDEAMRTGSYGIGADHIVLGILRHRDNNACRALAACGIDTASLKEDIDARVFAEQAVPWEDLPRVRPTRSAAALLHVAAYESLKYGRHEILSSHVLLALLRSGSGAAADFLRNRNLDYDALLAQMRKNQFILPHDAQQAPLPRLEDLMGPLGEELTRLFGSVQSKTNYFS